MILPKQGALSCTSQFKTHQTECDFLKVECATSGIKHIGSPAKALHVVNLGSRPQHNRQIAKATGGDKEVCNGHIEAAHSSSSPTHEQNHQACQNSAQENSQEYSIPHTFSTRFCSRGAFVLLLGEAAEVWLVLAAAAAAFSPFRAASVARRALRRSLPIIGPVFAGSLSSSCCANPLFLACQSTDHFLARNLHLVHCQIL